MAGQDAVGADHRAVADIAVVTYDSVIANRTVVADEDVAADTYTFGDKSVDSDIDKGDVDPRVNQARQLTSPPTQHLGNGSSTIGRSSYIVDEKGEIPPQGIDIHP